MRPFESVRVIGRGRLGGAVAARLQARGLLSDSLSADLVLLAVPDSAIDSVARDLDVGPWVAHASGATSLASLAPHVRRLGVHPLQTFTRGGGAEQLDGAWAAVTAENVAARACGHALAEVLGLHAFDLDESQRVMYHAGASIASNFLVTIHRAAVRAFEAAGAPSEALLPLMQRTMDNHFDLTGPIARGDYETVAAHLAVLGARLPDLEPLYRALAAATRP